MGNSSNPIKEAVAADYSYETEYDVSYIKVSPNKKFLAVGWGSNNIRIWDLQSNSVLGNLEGCTYSKASGNTATMSFSPCSKFLAYRWNTVIRITEIPSLNKVREIQNEVDSVVINYSPNGKHLLVGNKKDIISVYNVELDSSMAKVWSGKARTQSHI